ncbi:hypothetical protein OS493_006932 [Desmophyllum pertusum]|uniref:KHA domain-containing protein n=1 Tax=Desmophyllum pertusum TaxID=174260 RepID=A0A9W9ZS25_9CNID|nr:hypothetical protein OS493_006932 [Desmophyllum pertusum]
MRICLRPNGATSGEVIECPDSIEELASVAREMLEIESPVFFSATGDSVNSLSVLRDNDVIYVAKVGDMFSFQSKVASRAKEFEAFSKQKRGSARASLKRQFHEKRRKSPTPTWIPHARYLSALLNGNGISGKAINHRNLFHVNRLVTK